ncbi:hypothetical protein C8J57DRAFT_1662398 [Mycena rebaudengoi]|nr:hypothetical protein C8J57DRAFT_1662398 [Mycena rebaudengoi]
MGATSSKASARSLPKRVTTPPWSGARTPRPTDSLNEAASETKNDVIDRDSRDPQFLSKLQKLGPVRVDHHMQTVRTAELANQMFNSRVQSENEVAAGGPTPNRVQASQLSQLLDERKAIRSQRDMEFLAKRYGIDVEKLENVAKFVNTPSVEAQSTTRAAVKNEERPIMRVAVQAVWIEPRLKSASAV